MELREEVARLGYQYSELIDDKDIQERWLHLANREKWFDMADKVIELINSGE